MRWRRYGSVYCLAPSTWDRSLRAAHEAGHALLTAGRLSHRLMTRSRLTRLALAGHEGGHSLLAVATGRVPRRASIEPSVDSLGRVELDRDGVAYLESLVERGSREQTLRRAAMREAVVLMGGHAGATLCTGRSSFEAAHTLKCRGYADDLTPLLRLARSGDSDVENALTCAGIIDPDERHVVSFVRCAHDIAFEYLTVHRKHFERVVEALLAYGTIDPRPLLADLSRLVIR